MDKEYAFIFDIGRVLLDFDFERAVQRLDSYSAYDLSRMRGRMFGSEEGARLMDDYELGKLDSSRFHEEAKRIMGLEIGYEDFARIWSDIFTENDNIKSLLGRVGGYPKVIVSNTCAMHWERQLASSHISRHFKEAEIIKSYEVGLRKPDMRIYELAKEKLPCDREILYFDDVPEYARMASAVGIRGIKYDCRTDDIEEVLSENGIVL
jgi:FMN phosphatase YigB (HAD superfamily)